MAIVHKDIDGHDLTNGTRVAFVDMVSRTGLGTGVVVGSTPQRVNVKIEGELNPANKTPRNLVKMFTQNED